MIQQSQSKTRPPTIALIMVPLVVALSHQGGLAPMCPAATPEAKESELPREEHVRLYQKSREMVDRWDAVLRLPDEARESTRLEMVGLLRQIDPEKLADQAKLIPLPKLLEVIAEKWPEQLAQATSLTVTREGALWTFNLRDPSMFGPDTLGDDHLIMVYLDGFSGTVLFPLHRP